MQVMRRGSDKEPAYHPEGNGERDPRFKQPIGYRIIANPFLGKVFAYKRASGDGKYSEGRLEGKWSWGFGGHIEPSDTGNGNPIRESLLRELQEEVKSESPMIKPDVLGYIYHDFDVHQVHFGILYLVGNYGEKAEPRDSETEVIRLCSLEDLEAICNSPDCQVEEWSRTALEPLRKLL